MSSNQTSNEGSAKDSDDSNHSKWKAVHAISSDWIGCVYRIVDCILLFCVIVYQSSSLSYYITQYNDDNNGWYFLFLIDFLLAFLFIFGSICAIRYYRKLHVHKRRSKSLKSSLEVKLFTNDDSEESSHIFRLRLPQWMGALPLVWISWLFYVIVMASKIFIVHLQDIAVQLYQKSSPPSKLDAEPHTIRLCLGAMTIVFLLWVEIHRNHNSNQSMETIKELTTSVVFEIFDSIDLLELLIPRSHNRYSEEELSLTGNLSVVIVILSTINLLLPTIGLYRLSRSRFDSHKMGLRMNILHNCFRIVFVNIPYMVLRIFYWVSVEREISIFLMKNALFLFVSIRHIVSEVHELRKKQESQDETEYPLRVVVNHQENDTTIEG